MNNILKLTGGELRRMVKYMILPVSVFTSLLWCAVFFALSAEEARGLAPLFLFTDVALMSIMLLGASYHLEKQEGTIKSVMMLPVTMSEILISKTISSMILALESTVIISAALYFIHGVTLNYAVLLLFVIIASAAHAAIGFALSLFSRDFSSLLGILMTYMTVFTVPSILLAFDIIPRSYEWVLMVSPSQCAFTLLERAVTGVSGSGKIVFSLVYLIVISALFFRFIVYPKFKSNAVRG